MADDHWDDLVNGVKPPEKIVRTPILHVIADTCAEILSPRMASATVAIQPLSPRRQAALGPGASRGGSSSPRSQGRVPDAPNSARRGDVFGGSPRAASPRVVPSSQPRVASYSQPRGLRAGRSQDSSSPRGLSQSPRVPMDSPRALPSSPRTAAGSLRRTQSPGLPPASEPERDSSSPRGRARTGSVGFDHGSLTGSPRSRPAVGTPQSAFAMSLGSPRAWGLDLQSVQAQLGILSSSPRSKAARETVSALPASPRMKVMSSQAGSSPRSTMSPRGAASPRSPRGDVSPRSRVSTL